MQTQEKDLEIDELISLFKTLYSSKGTITFQHTTYLEFKDKLTKFIYKNHLNNSNEWSIILKNLVFTSQQYMTRNEADIILIQLEKIKLIILQQKNEAFGDYIHPNIKELIFDKFNIGQYADAVETAFKEINSRLKKICRKHYNQELDGKNLMEFIFSFSTPRLVFEGLSTDSERNVQSGYMQMFSGAITGIRNPKAHENMTLKKDSAIKRLIFASLSMDKIDEALKYSNISE